MAVLLRFITLLSLLFVGTIVCPYLSSAASTKFSKQMSRAASVPSVPSSVGNWQYQGCFTDSVANRTLPFFIPMSEATIEACIVACELQPNNYTYSGLEFSTECYCGNSLGLSAKTPDSNCNMVCGGDSSEFCGSANRLTLYHLGSSSSTPTTTTAPTQTPTPTPTPSPAAPSSCNPSSSNSLDFLRAYDHSIIDHFYTSSATEMLNAVTSDGYSYEGRAFGVFGSQQPSTVPLYRLYSPGATDHFYTTSAAEKQIAATNDGYSFEGIAAYVYSSQVSGSVPLYRLWLPIGDHFYTTSAPERDNAVTLGYTYEGVAAYVLP